MDKTRIIRNEDVERVLMGVPDGHTHLRICIKLKNGTTLVFQEATIANISRAYITLKTHPRIQDQELKLEAFTAEQRKEGYAIHQLIETSEESSEIRPELKKILERGRVFT